MFRVANKLAPALVLAVLVQATPAQAADVSFESLLEGMTNLERLARSPDPAFVHRVFSSTSPTSTDPDVADDTNWFSNYDGWGHVRTETDPDGSRHRVIMDADGPGAIVRIYSGTPFNGVGTVRVYLDHEPEPTMELNMMAMLGGWTMPFAQPIAGWRSNGWTSFLPIPFAEHCKVTVSQPVVTQLFYYHINYLLYEPGTEVETYTTEQGERHSDSILATAARLTDAWQPDLPDNARATPYTVAIPPGESRVLVESDEGPAAIYRFTCRATGCDDIQLLRLSQLEIAFDERRPAQVQSPLGDFFGTTPGLNTFQSLPAGVLDDGLMYVHWVMPFQRSMAIRVTNLGPCTAHLEGEAVTAPFDWDGRAMYFHAKWRTGRDIPTYPRSDWTFADIQGEGHYVGNMLYYLNPIDFWWGEGDDKIYLDGDEFPTLWGTGTEDYYGFSWGSTVLFSHAYHSMNVSGSGLGGFGHNCLTRFHVPDPIPFRSSFKFDMEVWHWAPTAITLAATSYWYARPGSTDDFAPTDPADLPVPLLPLNGGGPPICGEQGGLGHASCGLLVVWVVQVGVWRRKRGAGD